MRSACWHCADFPLFSGFWSKDAILHAGARRSISHVPFYLGSLGRAVDGLLHDAPDLLRLLWRIPFGSESDPSHAAAAEHQKHSISVAPHESPAVMTMPLMILATFAIFLGVIGTPAWPWFDSFLNGQASGLNFADSLKVAFCP